MGGELVASVTASPSGFLIAFGAGIASFLSPCVLPLVPGYCSMVTGMSVATVGEPGARGRTLASMGAFVGGFTLVFIALGAVASSVGQRLNQHKTFFAHLSGGIVLIFGLLLLLVSLPASVWSRLGARPASWAIALTQERRLSAGTKRFGPWAGVILGMAFAFAWTPCIGPVLGAVLALAAQSTTLLGGVGLLLAYSLGLAVPFLAAGLAIDYLTTFTQRFGKLLSILQLVGSIILIIFGILLLTDNVSWLSTQFSHLLNWLHLSGLTTS